MKTFFKKSWVLLLIMVPMITLPSYTSVPAMLDTTHELSHKAENNDVIGIKQLWQEFKTVWLKAPKIVRYGVYATTVAIIVAPALAVYTLRSPAVQKAYAEVVADMVALFKEQRPEIVADAVAQAQDAMKKEGPALLKETLYETMHLIAHDMKNACKKGLAIGLEYYRRSNVDTMVTSGFGDGEWPISL